MAEKLFVKITSRIYNFQHRFPPSVPLRYPVSLEIHPVAICNQTCVFCWSQDGSDHAESYLPTELLLDLIDDYADHGGGTVTFSGGGEPALHPDLDRIADKLVDRGLRYGMITNGLRGTDKFLDFCKSAEWVKVSLNGIDESQYARQYRNPNPRHLQSTINNINRIRAVAKNDAIISCSMIVTSMVQKDEDIEKFFHKALNDFGVKYILFRPYVGEVRGMRMTRTREDMKELAQKLTGIAEERGVYTNLKTLVRDINAKRLEIEGQCPVVQAGLMATVTSDGHVHLCLPLPRNGYSSGDFGSLKQNRFSDIWNSVKHQEVLHSQSNAHCPSCKYERMFGVIRGFSTGDGKTEEKRDKHWDFL